MESHSHLNPPALPEKTMGILLENDYVRYVIGRDGTNVAFMDKATGSDLCTRGPFATVMRAGKALTSSSASYENGCLTLGFQAPDVRVILAVRVHSRYIALEVLAADGEGLEELAFLDLVLKPSPREDFGACALALNLKTNVPDLPGPNTRLRAYCYRRFGMTGAKAAIVACPIEDMRQVMQEVVLASEDLPKSPVGGPWALDSENNRGSYLFNFGDLSEKKVDEWINLARSLGITQIDLHGGSSFRFGDCHPNPEIYPRGLASMKAVTDRLHEAGILAGLHTYAFFIDKRCPWVTPKPDPRLASDATFTLARPLSCDDTVVEVLESTKDMSATTGFFVRNSATLRIEDELVTYADVRKGPTYAFVGCRRGAHGTRAAAHEMGAKVHHLKECFGLFVPDADSTLFDEVAEKTAHAFNEGGFDMMYLDALDGEDVLGGPENGWHYGSKFVFEVCKRLRRPAIMEMSTFHHHLWYVRSRIGAWDHPNRSHKRFIDLHLKANESSKRMFLPAHLGWWAFKTWTGPQSDPTYPDDIEYLCCKCLATDTGLSIMGIDPEKVSTTPALTRLAKIVRTYEELRRQGYFPESIKNKLRLPGNEFTLGRNASGTWEFRPVQYTKHKVCMLADWTRAWSVRNEFARQPAWLRIEALMSVEPYTSPSGLAIACSVQDWSQAKTADPRIRASLVESSETTPVGTGCFRYSALSRMSSRVGAWTAVERVFRPPLDLRDRQGLGIWVHGDGQGEILNVQLRNPEHFIPAVGEHYIDIDFVGWRYFELVEPEGERYDDYSWPYGSPYTVYRESVDYRAVESLTLWYNNLPPDEEVACLIGELRALPLVKGQILDPTITVGKRTVTFPVRIETGSYLEFNPPSDCQLYGARGEQLMEVRPRGSAPVLGHGLNRVRFSCGQSPDIPARARVTISTRGPPLRQ